MSKDIRLETAREFLEWANKQSKYRRFKLADRWNHNAAEGDPKTIYLLEECGSGGTFRGNKYIYIPNDIGEPLSLEWKKNELSRFVGMWGIKKILKFLYGREGAEDWKAIQEVIEIKKAERERRIAAQNAQEVVNRMTKDLAKLDEYLQDADLKGMIAGDVTMPGLDDIRYVLEGFLETAKS